MRLSTVVLGCVLTLLACVPALAQSNIATVDVPVGVAALVPTTAPVATAAAVTGATPQPLPSGLGINSSDWSFQEVPVAGWLDNLAESIFGAFTTIMNKSIQLAQMLFYTLAITEFGWACGKWAISSTPLEEVVAEAYLKIVRLGLLYLLIGCTFTLPNGSPGWFPMIVGTIVAMAQSASGVSVMTSQFQLNGALNLTAGYTPGDVFTFFWNIALFVIKSAFTQQSLGNLFVGAFTGATGVWLLTALIAIVSGFGVMLLGVYTAFKYFATMIKTYMVASQAYVQGFLGSSLTASNGSGLFNAALNLGIELGAMLVIMGVMKQFLTLALNAMNLGFLVVQQYASSTGATYGPVGSVVVTSLGTEGVRLIAIIILDTLVVLWAYLVKTIPEQAAASISGRLDVRPGEMIAHMGSGLAPGKLAATAGAVAGGALGVKMLAGSAASGGAATLFDRAKGAATGAVQGGLFAGPAGALGGAMMGASNARSASASTGGGEPEGTVSGGGASGRGSGTGSHFSNREFAPKGAAPGNPTPDVGSGSSESGATADDRELIGAASRSGASAKRSAGGSVIDGSDNRAASGGASGGAAGSEVSVPPGEHANKHADGAETTIERSAGRATEMGSASAGSASGQSSSTGGLNDNADTASGGKKQGATGGAAQGGSDNDDIRDLAAAMRDNTAALRAHRFGGGASGAGGGNGGSSGGGGGSAGGDASAPSDPIFGGGASPMNPLNMMMYRNLLGGGRPQSPNIQPEHPAVAVDLSSLLR